MRHVFFTNLGLVDILVAWSFDEVQRIPLVITIHVQDELSSPTNCLIWLVRLTT